MRNRLVTGLVVSLAAGMLAGALGCGGADEERPAAPAAPVAGAVPGPPPQGAPATGPDPCALVTKADAEAALGEAVREPHRMASGHICRYRSATSELLNVTVGVLPYSADKLASTLEVAEGDWEQKREPGPKIGEQATWVGRSLFVVKGGQVLNITLVSRMPVEQARANMQAIAEKAVARIS